MNTIRFLNLDCVQLKNDALELLITQSVGPRIIRLSFTGDENILAELPDLAIDCPGQSEKMHFFGGHRLWHAPQVPERTHMPDNQPVSITEIERGLEVTQATEAVTGLQKTMRIILPDDSATVVVDHTVTNNGTGPVETAPWAITQLKPGGTAILPQSTENIDPAGVWPNRSLAFWPFTDIASPNIHWGNRYLMVDTNMQEGMMKFAFPNPNGWLGYHHNQTLFVKHSPFQPEADYFDANSSSHFFCQPEFLELETLGPRTMLNSGQFVSHQEVWSLHSPVSFDGTEDMADEIAQTHKLETSNETKK